MEFIYRIHKQDTKQFLQYLISMLENNPQNEKVSSYIKQIILLSLLEKDNLENIKIITAIVSSSTILSNDEKKTLLDTIESETSIIEEQMHQSDLSMVKQNLFSNMTEEELEQDAAAVVRKCVFSEYDEEYDKNIIK